MKADANGENVIPEFTSIIVILVVRATIIAALLHKKREASQLSGTGRCFARPSNRPKG